jgi:predicted heme/steroid binding protein
MDFLTSDSVFAVGLGILTALVAHKFFSSPQLSLSVAKNHEKPKELTLEKPKAPARFYTLDELRAFNGEDDTPIYIAIQGVIYDVSAKKDFYGPGAGYHLFAGREAGRALAKMSFDPADLENTDTSDLTFMEKVYPCSSVYYIFLNCFVTLGNFEGLDCEIPRLQQLPGSWPCLGAT